MSNLLSSLARAGILERSPMRGGPSYLRVAPRFLGHAEREAARRSAIGLPAAAEAVLESTLQTWDEYADDARRGAQLLFGILAERDQLGALRPAFPTIENYAGAAA